MSAFDFSVVAGGGGSADPIFETFGAPDTEFEFDTSSLTGLTALGTPTTENANTQIPDAYYVRQAASAGVAWKGRYVAVATPFTLITKVVGYSGRDQFNTAGIFVGASTPGGMHVFGPCTVSLATSLRATSWTDAVGGGGAEISSNTPYVAQTPIWLAAVVASSDDIDFWHSFNGYLWTINVVSANPPYTVESAGLVTSPENATWGVAAGFDFLRVWDSALTMPGHG